MGTYGLHRAAVSGHALVGQGLGAVSGGVGPPCASSQPSSWTNHLPQQDPQGPLGLPHLTPQPVPPTPWGA